MKAFRKLSLLVTMLAFAAVMGKANARQAAQPGNLNMTGVWRGQMEGMPAVVLVVSDESGSLSGAVLFYFQTRKTANDPWTSSPGLPEPVFNLHLDGNTLTFQVSHRRAHPPRTLNDPPVQFHLTVTGLNQGELVNESEKGLEITVVRSND